MYINKPHLLVFTYKCNNYVPQVIAQGGVVLHNVIDTAKSGVGVKDTDFSFTVSHNMTPRIKVLSLFARFDGELVADLLQLNVLCELEHKVCICNI